jgi:phenylpropionate dioxygenase-like ring-hydroxylating dioxygenase large terminal subunit
MYINFWYPVAQCHELTNEAPLRVRILSLDFVAFRDSEGNAHVLSDTCIHRGGALGAGKIVGDCVQCPYHGWQYDADGKCTVIPSLGDGDKPPARAKVDSYPVQEKYGIVFAFLGDLPEAERPPIWDIPEYEADDWRANEYSVFDVDYYYERSMENALDPGHNAFVHPKQGAPGMRQDFKQDPIEIEPIDEWGSGFMMPFRQENPEGGLMAEQSTWAKVTVKAGSGHYGPNAVVTWLHFSEQNKFHQYFFEAPIDENRTRIFFLNMRHFMMEPENDQRIMDVNMQIAQEDINVLLNLNPVRTPETLTQEVMVPADKPIVHYREMLKDWEKRGWRIDVKKLNELRGDEAVAIPSPQRRTEKNWVLAEVPRL